MFATTLGLSLDPILPIKIPNVTLKTLLKIRVLSQLDLGIKDPNTLTPFLNNFKASNVLEDWPLG